MDVNPLKAIPMHNNPIINGDHYQIGKQDGFRVETNLKLNPGFVNVYVWPNYLYLYRSNEDQV
jgi:hypothetical protein